jgi:IclR family transcriptional regulator, pca regulon regulatory protein
MTSAPFERTAASGKSDASPQKTMLSLAAALKVLGSFRDTERMETPEAIVFRSRMTHAKVRSVLAQLEQLGYVERHPSGAVFLTPLALTLGFAARPATLAGISQRRLDSLARATGATVSLAKLVGDQVVYLSRIRNGDVMSANLGVGSITPAWTGLIGRVLLAGLSHDELVDLAHSAGALPSPAIVPNWAQLEQELEDIRTTGHASSSDAGPYGALWCIGVPVGIPGSRPIAAASLSIAPHKARHLSRSSLLAHLRDAADDLAGLIASAKLE